MALRKVSQRTCRGKRKFSMHGSTGTDGKETGKEKERRGDRNEEKGGRTACKRGLVERGTGKRGESGKESRKTLLMLQRGRPSGTCAVWI